MGRHLQPTFISILLVFLFQEGVGHVVFVWSCDNNSDSTGLWDVQLKQRSNVSGVVIFSVSKRA